MGTAAVKAFVAGAVVVAFSCALVQAEPPPTLEGAQDPGLHEPGDAPAPFDIATNSGVYGGVNVGAFVPEGTRFTLSGPVSGAGRVQYKTGPSADALVGFRFNQFLAVELELGYARFDLNGVSGSFSGSGATASGFIPENGHVQNAIGLASMILTPLGKGERSAGFSPYFGARTGFCRS